MPILVVEDEEVFRFVSRGLTAECQFIAFADRPPLNHLQWLLFRIRRRLSAAGRKKSRSAHRGWQNGSDFTTYATV